MPENVINNETSSSLVQILGLPTPHDYALQGEERVLAVIARKVDELAKELYEVKKEKLLKEVQLPPELLEPLGLTKDPPSMTKKGRGYRPILAHEIIEAKNVLAKKHPEVNESMVARYFGVSLITYKKYAKMYNLWDPKPSIKGIAGVFDPEKGLHPLSEVLQGKFPNYPVYRVKEKLLRSGVKEAKCELCGYKERRVTDGKVPLILNFVDGNPKNHLLENLKLYCYNCTFTCGRGYVRSGEHYFDPDWLQGAPKIVSEIQIRY